ncbi:hypothetical protein OAQ99_04475 [Candidatus Kapabacteria bacterium]|nr:hypothetical protein [Candidatus Kapabacteria bacterium]
MKGEIERFSDLLILSGKSKTDFSKLLGLSPQSLHRYLEGKANLTNLSYVLLNAGYSVDWLLSGKGRIFLDHQKYHLSEEFDLLKIKKEVLDYIDTEFGEIAKAEIYLELRKNELKDFMDKGKILNYRILKKLTSNGFNFKPDKFVKVK